MKKLAFYVAFFLLSFIANAQSDFETGMQQAFQLWGEDKAQDASALFERIAQAEPENWLPNYYVALVNTTEAFRTKDKETIAKLLEKAQNYQDICATLEHDNAEVLVMQAMIYTAWIVYDPMTNGMQYSGKVMAIYEKASVLAPENPRVMLSKAEFEIGSARYFKQDTSPMCAAIKKANELFKTEKQPIPFYPKWGAERATYLVQECEKK